MVNRYTAICIACDRLRFRQAGGYCEAFPDGIPDDIAFGMHDHREPHDGDHGIRFKLRPGFERDLQEYEASKAQFEEERPDLRVQGAPVAERPTRRTVNKRA